MSQATITRSFSLISRAPDKVEARESINLRMQAFRSLENTYLDVLFDALRDSTLELMDFAGESKAHVKEHVYNKLELNLISSSYQPKIKIKERMKRSAIQYPYFAVRSWLIQTHYLSLIIRELITLLSDSLTHAVRFLQGDPLSKPVMGRLSRALRADCFGNTNFLSHAYISNLIGQVRNLFISNSHLGSLLSDQISLTEINSTQVQEFLEKCLKSFSRKKKGKTQVIPISELKSYFFKLYVARVKKQSTWNAKHVMKIKDMDAFKQSRNNFFEFLIDSLHDVLGKVPGSFTHDLAQKMFNEILEDSGNSAPEHLIKGIFKPFTRAARVDIIPTRNGFIQYFGQVLKNQLILNVKELFITGDFITEMNNELDFLKESLHNLVNRPKIRNLALPINQAEGIYEADFSRLTIKLSFRSKEFIEYRVKDEKGRINELMERGATTRLPVLTIKGRKFLLHLPFELPSNDLSKHSSPETQTSRVVIGVDLGVKHLAVLSVMDLTDPHHPVEIARYFIGMRTLFDKKFNSVSGRFESKERFNHSHSKKKSCIKRKLRNMRHEARNIQRKVHEYENHFSERNTNSPARQYKHYRLTKTVSGAWNRVKHLNEEIIHQLQHLILQIALYHNASLLKFENLKWSRHSKKKYVGSYLAFWQTHWFFSQVQESVKLQASLHGITFQLVNAAYTSQTCWECGKRGRREGRNFTCMNHALHASKKPIFIHSDLNAARVIALA